MTHRPLLFPLFVCVALLAGTLALPVQAGTLTCSVTTAAACTTPSVVTLRLSGVTDAHAELPSQATAAYDNNVICCSGVSGLGNTCSGTNATVAKLYAVTNSHIEQSSQANYSNLACLSVPAGGSVSVAYQASNCTGQDTTLGSMVAATNAHAGDGSSYTTKICGTASVSSPSLAFSISANSVGFGTLDSNAARYATGDSLGSASEVEAHRLVASTTAPSGYTITVQGSTLTSGNYTITAIGSTNTASVPTIEQFGLRTTVTTSGVPTYTPTISSTYSGSGFGFAADATTQSQVASVSGGDGTDSTYSIRYLANIAPQTESGSYTTNLTYVITANF